MEQYQEIIVKRTVQEELMLLLGWEKFLGMVPAIFTTILYAHLANRYGKRKVLALAILGTALSQAWVIIICTRIFPLLIRLVWTQCLLQFIGGGPSVVGCMLHLLALGAKDNDITKVKEPSSRSTATETWFAPWTSDTKPTALFKYHSALTAGTAVGLLASSRSITAGYSIWLLWVIGEAFVTVSGLIALLLHPEDIGEVSTATPANNAHLICQLLAEVKKLWRNTKLLVHNKQAILLISMSFLGNLGYDSLNMEVLLPYISNRYGRRLSSYGQLIQVILFLMALPIASYKLQTHYGYSSRATGDRLALGSGHLVMSAGSGYMLLVSSFVMTSLSPEDATIAYPITTILGVIANGLTGKRVYEFEPPYTESNHSAPRYLSTSSTALPSASETIQEDDELYQNNEFEYQSEAQRSTGVNALGEDVSDLSIHGTSSPPVHNAIEDATFSQPDFSSTTSWQGATPTNDTSSIPNAWEDPATSYGLQYPGPSYDNSSYEQTGDKFDTQDSTTDISYNSSATAMSSGSNSRHHRDNHFANFDLTHRSSPERVSQRHYQPPELYSESRTAQDTGLAGPEPLLERFGESPDRRSLHPESYTADEDHQQDYFPQPAQAHSYIDRNVLYGDEETAGSFDSRDHSDEDDDDDTNKQKRQQIIDRPPKPDPQPPPDSCVPNVGCGSGPQRMAGGPDPRPPPASSSRSSNSHRTRDSASSGAQKHKSHSGRKRSGGDQETRQVSESEDVDPETRKEFECWLAEYATWKNVTCACGFGYYTKQAKWIPGIEVRAGRAPPRPETPTSTCPGMLEVVTFNEGNG
ncbi:hypothetical protein EG329_006619 [Mollisiaceae sp. DMI_Dod_QoI]|nr:hypothetical protein EG329_006619 [Helotiales sp. DMI_Dod_QoI]